MPTLIERALLRPRRKGGFRRAKSKKAAAADFQLPRKNVRAPQPSLVLPGSPLYGLSEQQIKALGLTAAPPGFKGLKVEAESISAKLAYRSEINDPFAPSSKAIQLSTLPRMSAVMASAGQNMPQSAPPDLPSLLLNARICYMGMPIVAAVTELVIAELLWLNYDNPERPIYFYINSTGSQSADGKAVGFETEAYAIHDTLQYIRPEVQTVCVGKAFGNAAVLLSSGNKGKRYALPNTQIALMPPRANRTVENTTNLMIKANEHLDYTKQFYDYVALHTGRDKDSVVKEIDRTVYFTPEEAQDYGLCDSVLADSTKGLLDAKDYDRLLQQSQAAGTKQVAADDSRLSHADRGKGSGRPARLS